MGVVFFGQKIILTLLNIDSLKGNCMIYIPMKDISDRLQNIHISYALTQSIPKQSQFNKKQTVLGWRILKINSIWLISGA